MAEKHVEKAIRKYLDDLEECWHIKTFGITGLPDLIGCFKGKFFAMELKQPGKKATPLQKYTLMRLEQAGALTGVADSLEKAIDILKKG